MSKRNPADVHLFKVNNKSTRTRREIYSKLTIKIPERRHCRFGVLIVNFEHISHLVLVFPLLTLNMQFPAWKLIHDSLYYYKMTMK